MAMVVGHRGPSFDLAHVPIVHEHPVKPMPLLGFWEENLRLSERRQPKHLSSEPFKQTSSGCSERKPASVEPDAVWRPDAGELELEGF